MFTLRHASLQGWEILLDGQVWSCAFYEFFEDAVDIVRMWFPGLADAMLSNLKCEACGSKRDVQPESIGEDAFLLTCKACRSCGPLRLSLDAGLGKPCKKPHVVRELDTFSFHALARRDARRTGTMSTGSATLDRTLRMPAMPGVQPTMSKIIEADEAPTECQFCDGAITDEFIDAVLVGSNGSWGYFCPTCHRKHGIGLGPGKGQRYVKQDDGDFHQVEGGRKNAAT